MNEEISTYYDEFAPHYVPGWRSVQYYGPLVADFLLRAVTPECRVLDIGCGPGQLTSQLADDVEVVGSDVSPQMLASARVARPGGATNSTTCTTRCPRTGAASTSSWPWGAWSSAATSARRCATSRRCARRVRGSSWEPWRIGPSGPARRREFSAEGLPGVAMHAYDATAQLAAVTASGLAPYGYRYVPAWRHEEYGYVVHYGLWELRRDR